MSNLMLSDKKSPLVFNDESIKLLKWRKENIKEMLLFFGKWAKKRQEFEYRLKEIEWLLSRIDIVFERLRK